jgi:hypothetical protein
MKLIAYGSLMSKPSLRQTLTRTATLKPIRLSGWRRVFDAPFDGYAFLNLKRDPRANIEAAYFEISDHELILFAEREAGSQLVEVMPEFYAFVWPQSYCQILPALRSYIQLCELAAKRLKLNFAVGLDQPAVVIEDLSNPLYK